MGPPSHARASERRRKAIGRDHRSAQTAVMCSGRARGPQIEVLTAVPCNTSSPSLLGGTECSPEARTHGRSRRPPLPQHCSPHITRADQLRDDGVPVAAAPFRSNMTPQADGAVTIRRLKTISRLPDAGCWTVSVSFCSMVTRRWK